MAATNFTPIQLYFSTTASAVPVAANLAQGELAINIADGKLYYEDGSGVVQVIATKGAGTIGGSTTQIQYNNAGALAGNAAMTFNSGTSTATLTTLNLTNALGAIYGGTAQSTYAQGDFLYASAANTLAKLGIGANTYILTSTGSVPQWVAPSSIAVLTATNLAGGLAGSVPYQSALDTTTFLAIGAANRVMTSTGTAPQWVTSLTGLTGVSSSSITDTGLTSGRVTFASTSGLLADSANLTFNGTTLTTAGLSNSGFSTLVKTLTLGDTSFNGTAVFAAATPAKLYMGTGTVTDVTSAISATNAIGAIASLGITPIAATNTSVTYTNAATLYIAGAPSAGTNVTLTNPYSLYVAGGAVYLGGNTAVTGTLNATGQITSQSGNDTSAFKAASATTGYSVAEFVNTAGRTFIGVEGAANTIMTNSTAGATILESFVNKPVQIGVNGILVSSFSSTGLAVTGTLSATGSTTVGDTSSGDRALIVKSTSVTGIVGSQTSNSPWGGGISTYPSINIGSTTNHPLIFGTNNTGQMLLDSSGNLGVGTSSPSQKLTVNGVVASIGPATALTASSTFLDYNTTSNLGRFAAVGNTTGAAAPIYFSQYSSNGSVGRDAAIIDSAGNLGLGVAPSAWSTLLGLQVRTASLSEYSETAYLSANAYYAAGWKYINANYASQYIQTNGQHQWWSSTSAQVAGTNPVFSQAMTLTAAGNLLVGTTSGNDGQIKIDGTLNGANCAVWAKNAGGATSPTHVVWNNGTTGDNKFVEFYTETSATVRGSITYNRAGGLVAYNVTSDYRAKDIIGPVTDSGVLIDSVPVYMGKMKDATQERPMFIAHEVPAYAHTGEKDAVDKDGKPVYQQMDASALIPVMWAEIQSLRARVAQLESKL